MTSISGLEALLYKRKKKCILEVKKTLYTPYTCIPPVIIKEFHYQNVYFVYTPYTAP
jgi:hypothetical protein